MKRDLILGIALTGAAALSSCSSANQLASARSVYDDDMYYTSARAGDAPIYANAALANYNNDDDYYYYGDYASRLNRFSSSSPFDYNDDFYYSYVPYNNGFGAGTTYDRDYFASYYGFAPNPASAQGMPYNDYIYSPYNYGYSPFFDYGYDDLDYGLDYGAVFIGGGGGGVSYSSAGKLWSGVSNTVATTNPNARGARTTPSPGITRLTASLPGRPVITNSLTANNSRQTRDNNNNNTVQRQSVTNTSNAVSTSSASGGGASRGSSGGGGGGGGRPGRP